MKIVLPWGAVFAAATLLAAAGALFAAERQTTAARPNILWLTCEDTGPQLGCYGDRYADTPNLDRLASRGLRYLNAYSNSPVCAPARTTIISGVYPPATGSEHMRSMVDWPRTMVMYPTLLREAGYYCTNNVKEDYNLEKHGQVWHESSKNAHWRNREAGRPFFAIFNSTTTHESQIRTRPHTQIHDPAQAPVPTYYPDTPEVRQDWAQYYDKVSAMDAEMGRRLQELEDAGLAEDTIVFFFGDHGPGMPRGKRWLYDSGLQVPLIVYFPEKFRHLAPKEYRPGEATDRLVSFVDLAPTLLSLVGAEKPQWMHGRAFLGPKEEAPHEYVYGYRARMDERFDLCRSVRDKQYLYIRNYMPHLPYGQHLAYMFQTPTTVVWKRLFDEGQLHPVQARFWQRKPPEELYDTATDPDQINNLVGSQQHRQILERMRKAHRDWVFEVRDLSLLPEPEMHLRAAGSTPYEMGRDPAKYPLEAVFAAADVASKLEPAATPELIKLIDHADSAVRYWGALGLLMRGEKAVEQGRAALTKALDDSSVCVRIVAAEALAEFGPEADRAKPLAVLAAALDDPAPNADAVALNAIDRLGAKADPLRPILEKLSPAPKKPGDRTLGDYRQRMVKHLLGQPDLE